MYPSAYRRLILAHLKDLSASLTQPNLEGVTGKDLLDLADSVYQYHLVGTRQKNLSSTNQKEEEEWRNKLSAELDDEYSSNWGRYEADFLQPDLEEAETYDSWAERMIFEHQQKRRRVVILPQPQEEAKAKSSWTHEDQQRFLKEEESRKRIREVSEIAEKRYVFLAKLQALAHSEQPIKASDLPFGVTQDVESIGNLILFHVKEMKEVEAKRKALKELQRLWHPDKFAQKFGQRLGDEIRTEVLNKITEISQYLNVYNCSA